MESSFCVKDTAKIALVADNSIIFLDTFSISFSFQILAKYPPNPPNMSNPSTSSHLPRISMILFIRVKPEAITVSIGFRLFQ